MGLGRVRVGKDNMRKYRVLIFYCLNPCFQHSMLEFLNLLLVELYLETTCLNILQFLKL